jgi:hypothetical protein
MVAFPRLLRVTALPLAVCLSLVGCGGGEGDRVPSLDAAAGVELVDICPMLDQDRADDECGPYRVVSLIEPGPLTDRVRTADVVHGQGADSIAGGRTFTGTDGDIVSTSISTAESDLFNPADDRFVYQAWLSLSRDQMAALRALVEPSWNVMQRGFADSRGGQWKLSLVTVDGEIQAQCVVRDGDGEVLRVHSRHRFRPDVEAAISCLFDARTDELRVVVERVAGDRDDRTDSGNPLGVVAPHDQGDGCWADVADQLVIGNKPVCGSTPPGDDDRFQGTVRQVRVLQRHRDR